MTGHEDDERIADRRAASRMNEGDGEATRPEATAADSADAQDAEAKAGEYYRNWQRSAADFSNYKKRVEQERGEVARLAKAALVINLLPIADDFERAAATVDSHLAGLNWVQGVLAIQQKLARLLDAMDVREIAAAGAQFDPAQHEAIGHQPGEDGKVVHVAQKGYLLGDKVLRPAMVMVGDGTKAG